MKHPKHKATKCSWFLKHLNQAILKPYQLFDAHNELNAAKRLGIISVEELHCTHGH